MHNDNTDCYVLRSSLELIIGSQLFKFARKHFSACSGPKDHSNLRREATSEMRDEFILRDHSIKIHL